MFRSEARRGTSACATWMHGNMGCMTHLAQPITVCENWWCLLTPCCPPLPWVEHPPQSCLNFLQPVGLCPAQMSEVRSAARQTCARNWIVPWTCIADIWGKQECTADVWTAKCGHATGHSALRCVHVIVYRRCVHATLLSRHAKQTQTYPTWQARCGRLSSLIVTKSTGGGHIAVRLHGAHGTQSCRR